MATTTTHTTLTGTVVKVNGNGFKLDAHDWLNISRYAQPDEAPMPAVGERVTVNLDKAGFVRRIERVPSSAHSAEPENEPPAPSGVTPRTKDTVVTRLAVLNTATAMLGGGHGHAVDADAVLALAARLEGWATRA